MRVRTRRAHILVAMVAATLLTGTVEAVPFQTSGESAFRDNRDEVAVGGIVRDTLQLNINLFSQATGSFLPGATVIASRGLSGGGTESFALRDCNAPGESIFSCYFGLVPLPDSDSALRDARLNATWDVSIESGTDTGNTTIGAYGTGPGTGALPFAENAAVAGPPTEPTIQWDLPAPLADLSLLNDGNVDRWKIRINEFDPLVPFEQAGQVVFDLSGEGFAPLPLDTTSFTVPAGFITEPGDYLAQIRLEGVNPFNRSRVYVPFSVNAVPGPATAACLAVGVLALVGARRRRFPGADGGLRGSASW